MSQYPITTETIEKNGQHRQLRLLDFMQGKTLRQVSFPFLQQIACLKAVNILEYHWSWGELTVSSGTGPSVSWMDFQLFSVRAKWMKDGWR